MGKALKKKKISFILITCFIDKIDCKLSANNGSVNALST